MDDSINGTKFRRGCLKYSVDENFFKVWSRKMAYILGFTYADGNIHRTSLSWDIQKRDVDILGKINKALHSTYKIKEQRKSSYRLRINNQILIGGAIKHGLLSKKNIRNEIPKIPKGLIRHFVRGYLDGDGWVVIRDGKREIDVGFASGNEAFLKDLNKVIKDVLSISAGKVRAKHKITPRGIHATVYQLEFYTANAVKILKWLYGDFCENDIYLERKHDKYLEAMQISDFLESGTRKVRVIQRDFGRSMKELLDELFNRRRLNGVQIAEVMDVHCSSVYRWLSKTGIKYPVRRTRKNL